MNNDELKKKIVKVLQELRASKPIVPNDYGLQIISCTTDREIADALISAGIGDVSEWKRRAEVAEQKATVWKDCANKWQKYYKEQAEKELAEENNAKET